MAIGLFFASLMNLSSYTAAHIVLLSWTMSHGSKFYNLILQNLIWKFNLKYFFVFFY